jgi:uncharacterized protein
MHPVRAAESSGDSSAITPAAFESRFWDAAARHQLVVLRCAHCGRYQYPPSGGCENCAHVDFQVRAVSGLASLWSWTVTRRQLARVAIWDCPYLVTCAELVEQPGLTMVTSCPLDLVDPAALRLDMPLEVAFVANPRTGAQMPHFVPRTSLPGTSLWSVIEPTERSPSSALPTRR